MFVPSFRGEQHRQMLTSAAYTNHIMDAANTSCYVPGIGQILTLRPYNDQFAAIAIDTQLQSSVVLLSGDDPLVVVE